MLEELKIRLHPDVAQRLEERLELLGMQLEDYLLALIVKDLDRKPSLDEVLAPVREQFRRSGMTQAELDKFADELIKKAREARKSKSK